MSIINWLADEWRGGREIRTAPALLSATAMQASSLLGRHTTLGRAIGADDGFVRLVLLVCCVVGISRIRRAEYGTALAFGVAMGALGTVSDMIEGVTIAASMGAAPALAGGAVVMLLGLIQLPFRMVTEALGIAVFTFLAKHLTLRLNAWWSKVRIQRK